VLLKIIIVDETTGAIFFGTIKTQRENSFWSKKTFQRENFITFFWICYQLFATNNISREGGRKREIYPPLDFLQSRFDDI